MCDSGCRAQSEGFSVWEEPRRFPGGFKTRERVPWEWFTQGSYPERTAALLSYLRPQVRPHNGRVEQTASERRGRSFNASQGQNPALTVLDVPHSLDSGTGRARYMKKYKINNNSTVSDLAGTVSCNAITERSFLFRDTFSDLTEKPTPTK